MTPKEKAKELVEKMASPLDVVKINLESKRCALIAVDEILKTNPHEVAYIGDKYDPLCYTKEFKNNYEYWTQVKNEIEKL